MSKAIAVLIAGGRKLLREGLTLLLEKHRDVKVVGEASDSSGATRLIDALNVDVLILPMSFPESALRELKASHPHVKIVTLGTMATAQSVRETLSAGASACLTKECASSELILAIRAVAMGRRYLSPQLNDLLVTNYVESAGTKHRRQSLSARETEVLRGIATGKSTKEIAYELGVAAKTIETHRRRMMIKLDKFSVAELTQYALMTGLIRVGVGAEI